MKCLEGAAPSQVVVVSHGVTDAAGSITETSAVNQHLSVNGIIVVRTAEAGITVSLTVEKEMGRNVAMSIMMRKGAVES